jgi:hypothetical protein
MMGAAPGRRDFAVAMRQAAVGHHFPAVPGTAVPGVKRAPSPVVSHACAT